jgi:DNA polymerase-3 subunit beta
MALWSQHKTHTQTIFKEITMSVITKSFTATATLGAFVTALKAAGAGVSKRPPVPVLSGVKIQALGGYLSISGFDYETFAHAEVIGGSATGDAVVVSHKMLLDMLVTAGKRATKRISDAWPLTLELEGNKLAVNINGTSFSLGLLPVENYPDFPSLEASGALRVDAGQFIRRMDSAMVAASTDDTLPILTSVKLEVENGVMSFLSTDRYRLVLAEMPVVHQEDYSILIPAKVWKGFKRVLSAKGGELVIRFTDPETAIEERYRSGTHRRIGFRQGAIELDTLGVDGQYPKIRSLFPDSPEIVFEMDADLLAALVAQVSVTAERNTPVRFTYNGIDSLRIDAGTGEDAQAEAFMPYSSPRGNRGFAVAFNPTYLAEALKDLKGQTVQFCHTSAPKPALVIPVESEVAKHMIMPVRLP